MNEQKLHHVYSPEHSFTTEEDVKVDSITQAYMEELREKAAELLSDVSYDPDTDTSR